VALLVDIYILNFVLAQVARIQLSSGSDDISDTKHKQTTGVSSSWRIYMDLADMISIPIYRLER